MACPEMFVITEFGRTGELRYMRTFYLGILVWGHSNNTYFSLAVISFPIFVDMFKFSKDVMQSEQSLSLSLSLSLTHTHIQTNTCPHSPHAHTYTILIFSLRFVGLIPTVEKKI